jgi:hypothetical protein
VTPSSSPAPADVAPAPATVVERRAGSMRWLTVRGERQSCFLAVGAKVAETVRQAVAHLPELQSLRRALVEPDFRTRFDRLVEATTERFPDVILEVEAMATGAGVDVEDLLLMNMRGDLGDRPAGGCSDIAVGGAHAVLGHNEDGDVVFDGRLSLLTLQADGDQPVCAVWYPGMLPANAFVVTSGLAWGIDHVPVADPPAAPGRHFVARALQRNAGTLDAAVDFLGSEPTAGGFAYNFAELGTGRVATVETAAGASASTEADTGERQDGRTLWHTNHLRYLHIADATAPADAGNAGSATPSARSRTCARGDVLSARFGRSGAWPPDRDQVTEILTTPLPGGVRQDGPTMTLCTAVVDVAAREVMVLPAGGEPAAASVDDLLAGSVPTD